MMVDAAHNAHCAVIVYERLLALAKEQGLSITGATIAKAVTGGSAVIRTRPTSSTSTNASSSTMMYSAEYELTFSDLQDLNASIVAPPSVFQRPRHVYAYNLWHFRKKTLDVMCSVLQKSGRAKPLKGDTIMFVSLLFSNKKDEVDEDVHHLRSYIIEALKADPSLKFDTKDLMNSLIMDPSSWARYRPWIESRDKDIQGMQKGSSDL
jgi:hypothetical protein